MEQNIMSSQQFFHSITNQLTVVLGRAELLALRSKDRTAKESSKVIITAAQNICDLVKQFQGRVA
jgi:nitrogen-specific signal transduction histidine kinase